MTEISHKEWMEVARELENFHAIFYQIWIMGKPILDKNIDTAAVSFDKNGNYCNFHFNPWFWKKLNSYLKAFVVCHEAIHVINNHGMRTKDASNGTNECLDIVVNHLLVNQWGFERKIIDQEIEPIIQEIAKKKGEDWDPESKLCWVDTIFPKMKLPNNESFEFYYTLFKKQYGDGNIGTGKQIKIDSHANLNDINKEQVEDLISKIYSQLNQEEKKSLKKICQQAGVGSGIWDNIKDQPIIKKKKWETIIKKWSMKYINSQKDSEQWTRKNRRQTLLPSNLFLPSEMETNQKDKEKKQMEVFFFIDTSGSCWEYKDRFIKAARSLPEKSFKIRLFCFDSYVEEINIRSNFIYGSGGTSFSILEKKVQNITKGQYPEAIFIVTDGYGDKITPQFPERWHWLLLPKSTKQYIDPKCQFHLLSDYE